MSYVLSTPELVRRSELRVNDGPDGKDENPLLPILFDRTKGETPETAITIPGKVEETLRSAAGANPAALVSSIMTSEDTVNGLVKTGIWSGADDLRGDLNKVAFGQPNDHTIEAVRKFAATVDAGAKDGTAVRLVVASHLLDRRLKAPEFMAITDELLRAHDPELAENLEGLLKGSAEIQRRAFQWLFDRLILEAEKGSRLNEPNQQKEAQIHLLTISIILKQFNQVLANTDEAKWLDLQVHMIMRFGERVAEESKGKQKVFMWVLLLYYPTISRDFLLAVDTNFSKIFKLHELGKEKAEQTESLLRPYGGFDNYAQAIETLLSFAVIAWPDTFYDYLNSRYKAASPTIQAQYLNSMKWGVFKRNGTQLIMDEFHDERLKFVLRETIRLSGEKSSFIRARLNQIMEALPKQVIDYLFEKIKEPQKIEEKPRYFHMDEARRSFVIEFILKVASFGWIDNARERVLPLIMFEIEQEKNFEIKEKIFFSDYFSDEFVGSLDEKEAKALRLAILTDYEKFIRNDVLEKNLVRIMANFGIAAIEEAFQMYEQHISTQAEKAMAVLRLAGRVAALFDANGDPDKLAKFSGILEKIAKLAKESSSKKHLDVTKYDDTREQISKDFGELEGLVKQAEILTHTAQAANSKVEGLDKEETTLNKEQDGNKERLRQIANEISGVREEQAKIQAAIRQFPIYQRAIGTFVTGLARKWQSPEKKKKAKEEAPVAEGGKPTLQQLRIQMLGSEESLAQLSGEETAIRGRVVGNTNRLERIIEEKAEAEKRQVHIAEEFNIIKLNETKLKKNTEKAEETLDKLSTSAKETVKRTAEYHSVLRNFLKSPSLTIEMATMVVETLRFKAQEALDGHILVTLIAVALDPRFPKLLDLELLKTKLAEIIRIQAERGLLQSEVMEEIQYLTERVRDGSLVPVSSEDSLYKALQGLLREKIYDADSIKKTMELTSKIAKAQDKQKKVTERAIEEVKRVVGAAGADFYPPIRDFLRMKFKNDEGGYDKKTVEGLEFFFIITAIFSGIDQAIEALFYQLAGEGGAFFVRPNEPEIKEPKNRAETIEKRYRDYYVTLKEVQEIVYKSKNELFRIGEGYGWDKQANQASLGYFAAVFHSEKTNEKLWIDAERTLWLFVFEPWLTEKEETPGGKLTQGNQTKKVIGLSIQAMLYTMERYVSNVPEKVIPEDVKKAYPNRRVGRYEVGELGVLAYLLAKKMIQTFQKRDSGTVRNALPVLKKLKMVFDPSVTIGMIKSHSIDPEDPGTASISATVTQAIDLLEGRIKFDNLRPEREARPGAAQFSLPQPRPISRPQLPGKPEDPKGKRSELREVNNQIPGETSRADALQELQGALQISEQLTTSQMRSRHEDLDYLDFESEGFSGRRRRDNIKDLVLPPVFDVKIVKIATKKEARTELLDESGKPVDFLTALLAILDPSSPKVSKKTTKKVTFIDKPVGYIVEYKGVRGFVTLRHGPAILLEKEESLVGQTFPAIVLSMKPGKDPLFSIREGKLFRNLTELVSKKNSGETIEVEVIGLARKFSYNDRDFDLFLDRPGRASGGEHIAGLQVRAGANYGFIPASLIPIELKAPGFEKLLWRKLQARVIEIKPSYRNRNAVDATFSLLLEDTENKRKDPVLARRDVEYAFKSEKQLEVTVLSPSKNGNGYNVIYAGSLRGFIHNNGVLRDRTLESGSTIKAYVFRIDNDYVEFTMLSPSERSGRDRLVYESGQQAAKASAEADKRLRKLRGKYDQGGGKGLWNKGGRSELRIRLEGAIHIAGSRDSAFRAVAHRQIKQALGIPTVPKNTKLVVAISRFVFADSENQETLGPILHDIAENSDEPIVLFGGDGNLIQVIADIANVGLADEKKIRVGKDYQDVKRLFRTESNVKFHVVASENDPLRSTLQAEILRKNLGEVTYLKQGDMKSLLNLFGITEAMSAAYRSALRLAESA